MPRYKSSVSVFPVKPVFRVYVPALQMAKEKITHILKVSFSKKEKKINLLAILKA